MNIQHAMQIRHSVRTYLDKPIEANKIKELNLLIGQCNKEGKLNFQLILNEPKAFQGKLAHYGKFSNVKNYIAIIGPKQTDKTCGYYGEKLVLKAQQLGLNTCWVALTYSKIRSAYKIHPGEKLYALISIGYGTSQGSAHKSKTIEDVVSIKENIPEWFRNGVKAALLAPTALNQQKFVFTLDRQFVSVKPGIGFYTKLDLGIVKYHFEIGAGKENFTWE